MADPNARSGTRNSRFIRATPEAIYRALSDPAALAVWRAPGEMTGAVHHFDLREGGGYEMSLYYPEDDDQARGKSAEREDRFSARYVVLEPPARIVEAIRFHSPDPDFAGEMIMEVTLSPEAGGTTVSFAFSNLPPGIRPEDNETGTLLTLEKLARHVE